MASMRDVPYLDFDDMTSGKTSEMTSDNTSAKLSEKSIEKLFIQITSDRSRTNLEDDDVNEEKTTSSGAEDTESTTTTSGSTVTPTILEGLFFIPSKRLTSVRLSACGSYIMSPRACERASVMTPTRGLEEADLKFIFSSITYKSLGYMPTVAYEKYMLTPRHRLSKMSIEDYEREVWTDVPLLPGILVSTIRQKHDEELSKDESFVMHLKDDLHYDTRLKHLFHTAYSHATNFEMLSIFCSNHSAIDLFALLMIFLSKLESPVFEITQECVDLLTLHSKDIPESSEDRQQDLQRLHDICLQCDVKVDGWDKRFNHMLASLYRDETRSRFEEFTISNTLQHAIQTSLANLKSQVRRNLARFLLRNFMFEATRCVFKQFKKERVGLQEDDVKVLFKKIKEQKVTKLAAAIGPLFLELPEEIDTLENRFRVMRSLLWHTVPVILYRKQKQNFVMVGTIVCHGDCLCGYGQS